MAATGTNRYRSRIRTSQPGACRSTYFAQGSERQIQGGGRLSSTAVTCSLFLRTEEAIEL
jgi:hypothetical protein